MRSYCVPSQFVTVMARLSFFTDFYCDVRIMFRIIHYLKIGNIENNAIKTT